MPALFGAGYLAWIFFEISLMRLAGITAFSKAVRPAPVEVPVAGSYIRKAEFRARTSPKSPLRIRSVGTVYVLKMPWRSALRSHDPK